MNAENILTAETFAQTWTSTPDERRVAEIISVYKETHREIDLWDMYQDEKGLFVKDKLDPTKITYVSTAIDRETSLGKVEATIADNLDVWFRQNNKGDAFWISPEYPGKYADNKVVIHRIVYSTTSDRKLEKTLRSASVMFDCAPQECLNLAHTLFPEITEQLDNLEALRESLIVTSTDYPLDQIVQEVKKIDQITLREKIQLSNEELRQRATQISRMINRGATPMQIAYEMQRQGLLGEHSVSCPSASSKPTFSEFISKVSDRYEFKPGTCRICGLSTEVGPCNICRSCEKKL